MRRTTVNLLIDAAAAVAMLGMVATGYVLRFPLPPGTNRSLTLWGLTRHEWGEVHFWVSLTLLGAIGLHLCLHWAWVVTTVGKRLHLAVAAGKRHLLSGLLATVALVLGLVAFAWAAHNGVEEIREARDDVCPPPTSDLSAAAQSQGPAKVAFWQDVYPVLERSCLSCHGPKRQRGGFRVDRREDFFGKDGAAPLVVPGKSAGSSLIDIVSGARKDIPLLDRHRLPERDIQLLRRWIDSGAEWPPRPAKE